MTSDIYVHHVTWHCWIPCCRLSCLWTCSHALSDCIPAKSPYCIYIPKWDKGGGNFLGIEAKRNEKSLILFSLTKFHVPYMKSEWLYVGAGWAFCSVEWSGLQYFTLCKCFHATLHSVELRAFIITCWTKRWTERKLKCKKCHLNIRKRYFMVGVIEHRSRLPRELVESLPLEMFRRSPDMVLSNCCSSPCSEQEFGLDNLQRSPPASAGLSHCENHTANALLSLRIKYTVGQAKDNDLQIIKIWGWWKAHIPKSPDQGANQHYGKLHGRVAKESNSEENTWKGQLNLSILYLWHSLSLNCTDIYISIK